MLFLKNTNYIQNRYDNILYFETYFKLINSCHSNDRHFNYSMSSYHDRERNSTFFYTKTIKNDSKDPRAVKTSKSSVLRNVQFTKLYKIATYTTQFRQNH